MRVLLAKIYLNVKSDTGCYIPYVTMQFPPFYLGFQDTSPSPVNCFFSSWGSAQSLFR